MTADEPVYLMGFDLGQSADYTALAIAERKEVPSGKLSRTGRPETKAHYGVRHLRRFRLGTSYPVIVDQVAELAANPALGSPILVVDATGVGAPVFDLLDERVLDSPVIGVTITGGDSVTHESRHYGVPKRDLICSLNVLLQTKRLRFARAMPAAEVLRQERQAFRVKLSSAAHDTYGAGRENVHDDLVIAVALACWYGENCYVRQLIR